MIFLLIIAIVVGYFVGEDANKRGMNGLGWGIGAALMMLIFVPLYFILRKPLLKHQIYINDRKEEIRKINDDILDNNL